MQDEAPQPELSARARAWLDENREALEASNAWVEKHDLPLDKYRRELWAAFRKK